MTIRITLCASMALCLGVIILIGLILVQSTEHVLIARMSRRTVALPVDEVLGVREVAAATVTASPALLPRLSHVAGIVTLDNALLFIHDLDTCLSLDEAQPLTVILKCLSSGLGLVLGHASRPDSCSCATELEASHAIARCTGSHSLYAACGNPQPTTAASHSTPPSTTHSSLAPSYGSPGGAAGTDAIAGVSSSIGAGKPLTSDPGGG